MRHIKYHTLNDLTGVPGDTEQDQLDFLALITEMFRKYIVHFEPLDWDDRTTIIGRNKGHLIIPVACWDWMHAFNVSIDKVTVLPKEYEIHIYGEQTYHNLITLKKCKELLEYDGEEDDAELSLKLQELLERYDWLYVKK